MLFIPFISKITLSKTSFPSSASCSACLRVCSSSFTTTTTARLLNPSNDRIFRRCADGYMFVWEHSIKLKNPKLKIINLLDPKYNFFFVMQLIQLICLMISTAYPTPDSSGLYSYFLEDFRLPKIRSNQFRI